MAKKFLTAAAARYCSEHGRSISHRTLQKYRTKGPDDPGELGPKFFRDPVTQATVYFETDLLAWITELDARLIERGRSQKPKQLAA